MPFDAKIKITLVPDRQIYHPGESVTLKIAIQAEQETEVRGARAELVAWRRYRYQVEEWDHSDNRRERRTKTETDEWILTDTILGAERLPAGQPVERWVRFLIPPDAAPSGQGEIVVVVWGARVTVDVPRRRDAVAEAPLRVELPPDVAPVEEALTRESETARLTVRLDAGWAAAGQPLTGAVEVEPREDFSVRAVRLELIREEEVARDLGSSATTTVLSQEIAGEQDLFREQRYSFPFTLPIPADAMPSHASAVWRVGWVLRALLDRPRRGDVDLAGALRLFSSPREAPSA